MEWLKKRGILEWVLFAFALGIVIGLIFGERAGALKFLGDILINLLHMLVVPLVFTTLTVGIARVGGMKMGRMLGKSLFFYYITAIIALAIGLMLATAFNVGVGMELGELGEVEIRDVPPWQDILVGLVPRNIVGAMAGANMLQIVFFSVVFGLAMSWAGQASETVRNVLDSAVQVMFKLVSMVLYFAPVGVFGLIAWTVGTFGIGVLRPFAGLIAVVYLGCLIHVVVVHAIFVRGFCKVNPFRLFNKIKAAPIFAFTTCSSAATLPVSMKAVKEAGVSDTVSGFVLPIGATINMDGTALYQTVAAVFIANAFGVDLPIQSMIIIAVTAVLASIGTAGVPGAGLIMLMGVLSAAGIPLEGIAIIMGVDRILDMARTGVNVLDDITAACMVATTEGETLAPDLYAKQPPQSPAAGA